MALAPLKERERNTPSGIIGAGVFDSNHTNVARIARPAATPPITFASAHPISEAAVNPYTSAPSPAVAGRAPAQSTPALSLVPRLSGTRQNAMNTASSAMGTFTKKIARHENASTSQPPSTGPSAVVRADAPAQVPIARPRSFSGKVALMIARLLGTRIAPPIPCAVRATVRGKAPGANPHATEAI